MDDGLVEDEGVEGLAIFANETAAAGLCLPCGALSEESASSQTAMTLGT